jgi:hypothetical protein
LAICYPSGEALDEPQAFTAKIFRARAEAARAEYEGLKAAHQWYWHATSADINKDDARGRHTAHATYDRANWERTSANVLHKFALAESDAFEQRFKAEKRRVAALEKAREAGAPLDFRGQAEKLLSLIERDRNDAYVRLKCAYSGLKHVYGDAYLGWCKLKKLGNYGQLPDNATDSYELAKWTRNAIAFLAEFSQLDQGFTVCISLRDCLSENKWSDWKKGDYQRVAFVVDPLLFAEYKYVRLRGISAVLLSSAQELYPWRIIITPPLRQRAQTSEGLVGKFMDVYRGCQVCLGRVETASSYRMPDMAGMITLYNLSPCVHSGEPEDENEAWSIRAYRSPRSLKNDAIDDVRLELVLSGIPA